MTIEEALDDLTDAYFTLYWCRITDDIPCPRACKVIFDSLTAFPDLITMVTDADVLQCMYKYGPESLKDSLAVRLFRAMIDV